MQTIALKGIWFKSSANNSLAVSMKSERRLGELEEEAMPGIGAKAAWEWLSERHVVSSLGAS